MRVEYASVMWGKVKRLPVFCLGAALSINSAQAEDDKSNVDEIIVYGRSINMIGEAIIRIPRNCRLR